MDNITFTVTAYGKSVTITQPEDIDIYEFLDTCRDLALSMRYHEDSWKDAVVEMSNEYLEDDEEKVLTQHKTSAKEFTHWGPLYDSNC